MWECEGDGEQCGECEGTNCYYLLQGFKSSDGREQGFEPASYGIVGQHSAELQGLFRKQLNDSLLE